jgi:hypothetical protein
MPSSIVAKILYTHSNKHVNHGGIPLIEDITVLPTKVITFLGVEFDTENMVMRLPSKKLTELINLDTAYLQKEHIILKDLQSVIGSINWAYRVIVPGRAF